MHPLLRYLAVAVAAAAPAQSHVNFEAGPTAPLRLSPDGSRLFVADTVGHRLCVFDLRDPSAPFLLAEIPVGLAPVAVQARNRDEVWVACQLSDCVSVVDVRARAVIASIATGDESSDIVFAGNRAFVTAAPAAASSGAAARASATRSDRSSGRHRHSAAFCAQPTEQRWQPDSAT